MNYIIRDDNSLITFIILKTRELAVVTGKMMTATGVHEPIFLEVDGSTSINLGSFLEEKANLIFFSLIIFISYIATLEVHSAIFPDMPALWHR